MEENVRRILRMLAEHLDDYLSGDEFAWENLGERLAESGVSAEELQAVLLTLRAFSIPEEVVAVEAPPGKAAQRILSAEERENVSPEAWGFLLDLRERGALNAGQFELALDRLASSGMRQAGVDLAREVAAQIVLHGEGQGGARHGNPGSGH